jgi:glutamate racemase
MRNITSRPIGVFDSGVGGLTVARSVLREMPDENIIYFGDTARVPYGNKSKNTIIRFSREIMDFMMLKKVKMVVVACNTASSFVLDVLNREYPVPVAGVIRPGVREAIRLTTGGRIGVIGTNSTISSGAYRRELAEYAGGAYRLYSHSCPLFVPLVENGFAKDPITYKVAEKYLAPLRRAKIDTLILGCTHYPMLKTVIKKVMGRVKLVDSSLAAAVEVKDMLTKRGLSSRGTKKQVRLKCFVSDDPDNFRKTAGIFLRDKTDIRKVVL